MIAFAIIGYLLYLFVFVLTVRLIFDWVMVLARDFRPRGVLAAVLEVIYTITDPPLRALRRVIPPLRLGNAAIDLAFMILYIAVWILGGVFIGLGSR